MNLRSSLFLVAALLASAGCVSVRPNPEQQACTAGCVRQKNACLVEATSSETVDRCDEQHHTCMQPCLAMPRYQRAKVR